MTEPRPLTYADAGVDIDAKMGAVARAKEAIRSTFTSGVVGDVGGFGGLFRPDFAGMADPLLVASADGVGTKLKVAIAAGIHGTVGTGSRQPLRERHPRPGRAAALLSRLHRDGKMRPEIVGEILEGLAKACRENGCALLGGETAEMPGIYAAGDYDVGGHDRRRRGPAEAPRREHGSSRATFSSGFIPPACTPTAIRSRERFSSKIWG